jgi:hypothetical protein
VELRRLSAEGKIAAPRIFIYPMFGRPRDRAAARAHVRELKQMGADGIKLLGIDRDTMAAMEDEAHKLGLRIAHHVGVEETNAWDDIRFGTTSIEHWYGIPDAAIPDGVCRPLVARSGSGASDQGAASDGGCPRGVGADAGYL